MNQAKLYQNSSSFITVSWSGDALGLFGGTAASSLCRVILIRLCNGCMGQVRWWRGWPRSNRNGSGVRYRNSYATSLVLQQRLLLDLQHSKFSRANRYLCRRKLYLTFIFSQICIDNVCMNITGQVHFLLNAHQMIEVLIEANYLLQLNQLITSTAPDP